MTLDALSGMEVLRPIEFTAALAWLQGTIDREVSVVLNHHGHFFGCGFQGRLLGVQTLLPDHSAIRVVVKGGHGLFLDPVDVEAFAGGHEDWIEFHLGFGATVTVERACDSAAV